MKIEKVGVVANKEIELEAVQKVLELVKSYHCTPFVDSAQFHTDFTVLVQNAELYKQCDVMIALGGDGKILECTRNAAEFNVPVLGINFGRLGFLSEVEKDNLGTLDKLFLNEFEIEERMMFNCTISNEHETKAYHALNDVVISRGSYTKMISMSMFVNDILAENYHADGLILATPTGSTAYAFSAGGPVVEPMLDVMISAPICPHSLRSRAIIIGGDKTIKVKILQGRNSFGIVTIDGKETMGIDSTYTVEIAKSEIKGRLIKISKKSFYSILKEKLTERGV